MPQDHVETAKKAYAAWEAGNIAGVLSLLSDDFVNYRWNPTLQTKHPDVPWSGVWKCKDGMEKFIKVLDESTEFSTFNITNTFGVGNNVYLQIYYEGKVKATGNTFKCDAFQHWMVNEAGLLKFFTEYTDTHALVQAYKVVEK